MGFLRKGARRAEARGALPEAAVGRRSALIVDDDLTVAELNQAVFVGRDWTVRTAYNGLGALTAINAARPTLVLLDLMLPDIPGEKVLDALRAAKLTTKVIVVTGRHVTQRDFEPWTGLVVWVLQKPYAIGDLRQLVDWFESGAEIKPRLSQVGDV